jgi:hypothetical protein
MQESDAKFMYEWADEWVLKGTDDVRAKGTPVLVFGSYPFGSAKPWLTLASDPKALEITPDALKAVYSPHLQQILAEQKTRGAIGADKAPASR